MTKKLVPPDGGWGWVIVMAYALNNIVTIPIMQGFGLIFKDTFAALGMSATDASVIINVNSAFGMALGLINGPLLRTFGYRKISVVGSALYATGIILTSFGRSFIHILITYGILASLGLGLTMSSFSLALNTYFREKRGRAMGMGMTFTGLGPIFMPQVMSFLLSFYGIKGTVLILGGFSLHSVVGSLLLHPIKWHMKELQAEESPEQLPHKSLESIAEEGSTYGFRESTDNLDCRRRRKSISVDHDVETGSIYGFDTPLPMNPAESVAPHSDLPGYERRASQVEQTGRLQQPVYKWWSSGKSLETVNLGSSMKIFDETAYRPLAKEDTQQNGSLKPLLERRQVETVKEEKEEKGATEEDDEEESKRPVVIRQLHRVALFFDLNLLTDPIYVNIMLGMSVAIFAELNFSLLTPFILADKHFVTGQIATVMSTIASVDLVFRSISPFLGEWLKQPPRILYMGSLMLLIASRTTLIFAHDFPTVLVVAVGLGIAKGIRSVYMGLVIPSYVPIERLASASGIQMVVNGLFLLSAGPALGVIRDRSGSYDLCIVFINCVTALTITMWTTEMVALKILERRRRAATNVAPQK